MQQTRGFLMIGAAAVAFWKAWRIHHGPHAWLAVALGALALAMAAWHFTHTSTAPRK